MMKIKPRQWFSWGVLAACIAAALFFRRFVFVAWYPVAMSAAVSLSFGLSLFRRKTLCEEIAEKVPPHILPEGARAYARRLTVFWCVALAMNGLVAAATVFAPRAVWVAWNACLSYIVLWSLAACEWVYRRYRFRRVFHTSGSTGTPKRIVKTFAMLAKEVAYHRADFVRRGIVAEADGPGQALFLSTIEPAHMYGVLWRQLLPEACGCAADPEIIRSPESLLAKMRSAPRVVLVTTPSFLERFCAYAEGYDVPQTCVEIVTSGALLTRDVSQATQRVFGIAPLEIFGSTETGGVASRRQSDPCADGFDWRVFDPVKVSVGPESRLVVVSPFSYVRRYTMGDGVSLAPDGRRFALLGRRDRLAKINEQRVSLPEMEREMMALDEVREASLCVLQGTRGPVLGAVVALAHGAPFPGKRAAARALREKLGAFFPKGTAPRKYRFVYALPRNAQGKIRREEVEKILLSDFPEPHVTQAAETADGWSADFVFDAEASYFQGHFPGQPVLPGVVAVGMAHHFAEYFAHCPLRLCAVKKIKFTRIIRPAQRVRFTLARQSPTSYRFVYEAPAGVCASGILEVAP